MSETICTTAVALDSSTATVRTREAAIGNLFADAMRTGMRADAAILNGGGIRAGKTYEPGARISQGDVLAELPFNNRIVVVEISGARLKSAMENGLSLLPRASGRFPQVSGMAVDVRSRARARQPRHRDAGRRRAARRGQDLSRRGPGLSSRAAATTTRCSATPSASRRTTTRR